MDQAINTPLITEQVRDKPGSLRLTSGNLLDTHRITKGGRLTPHGEVISNVAEPTLDEALKFKPVRIIVT